MKININNTKKIEFKNYLKKNGLRLTKQRERIVDHFLKRDKHFSIEELYTEMKRLMPGIGFATVYRTLKLLASVGLATKRRFSDNITRFEPLHNHKHHDHMICIGCGKIVEFENSKIEKLQNEVASRYGFHPVSHKLELYGYCKKCMKKSKTNRRRNERDGFNTDRK